MQKVPPAVYGLPGPDPEAGRDAHNESHEVLDHEELKVGASRISRGRRARHRVLVVGGRTHVSGPRHHPLVEVGLLVEQTGEDDESWHGVQYGENADADHELLQLVGLRAVVFHDGADAEEGHEASQEEDRPQDQVGKERSQNEAAKSVRIPHAHEANAAQDVPWNTEIDSQGPHT